MKKGMIYLIAGLVALLLQTTILSHLPVKPDLVLVLVVYLGLSNVPFSGAVLAFVLGCLTDVFAGSTLGFFALTKTVIFLFVYGIRGRVYLDSDLARVGLVLIAGSIEAGILILLIRFTSHSPILASSMGRLIIAPIVVTTLAAPFCFILFKWARIPAYE